MDSLAKQMEELRARMAISGKVPPSHSSNIGPGSGASSVSTAPASVRTRRSLGQNSLRREGTQGPIDPRTPGIRRRSSAMDPKSENSYSNSGISFSKDISLTSQSRHPASTSATSSSKPLTHPLLAVSLATADHPAPPTSNPIFSPHNRDFETSTEVDDIRAEDSVSCRGAPILDTLEPPPSVIPPSAASQHDEDEEDISRLLECVNLALESFAGEHVVPLSGPPRDRTPRDQTPKTGRTYQPTRVPASAPPALRSSGPRVFATPTPTPTPRQRAPDVFTPYDTAPTSVAPTPTPRQQASNVFPPPDPTPTSAAPTPTPRQRAPDVFPPRSPPPSSAAPTPTPRQRTPDVFPPRAPTPTSYAPPRPHAAAYRPDDPSDVSLLTVSDSPSVADLSAIPHARVLRDRSNVLDVSGGSLRSFMKAPAGAEGKRSTREVGGVGRTAVRAETGRGGAREDGKASGAEFAPISVPRIEYQSLLVDNDESFLERVIAPVMAKYVPAANAAPAPQAHVFSGGHEARAMQMPSYGAVPVQGAAISTPYSQGIALGEACDGSYCKIADRTEDVLQVGSLNGSLEYDIRLTDELYLNVGDVVICEECFNDGWALAKNEKTNESGLIPTNFVIKFVANATDRATTATALKRVASLLYKKAPSKPLNDKQAEVQKKLNAINEGRDARAKVASNIGSLKVLVVGDSGIGKSALITTFFESPEIVDHDKIPENDGIPAIREFRASTIPTAELHTGEEPFNLTFVDSPGFGTFMDSMMIIRPIIDYHTAQFVKTDKIFAKGTVIPNLVKFLNAGTGCHTHVDACIYGILHRVKPVDIEFMRQLSSQVTVIPVMVKSDTLKPAEIFKLKAEILEELIKAKIPVYGFGLNLEEALELARGEVPGGVPFAVSSPGAAPKGALVGALNEFENLKRSLFYNHIDDLRQLSAER
ncbi:hypothetical protein HDU96_004636 [Phlyctochytrium bullatum]|nr:hypothetical protein HDU96_004636 [Phlyctochytrium bullatum]